jgi:hypothetical protein
LCDLGEIQDEHLKFYRQGKFNIPRTLNKVPEYFSHLNLNHKHQEQSSKTYANQGTTHILS